MPNWTRHLQVSLRSLRNKPSFSVIAIVTLALGIGANTAIFSVVRGVLLAPLGDPDAQKIVRVWPETPVNTEFFEHFATSSSAYEAVALHRLKSFALRGDGRPEEIVGALVTPQFFKIFGAAPSLGRSFAPGESSPGAEPVAILSDSLWQRRFGGDKSVVGQKIGVDGLDCTVIGVMPQSYESFDGRADLWRPLVIDPSAEEHSDMITYSLLGRLRPDVTTAQAQEQLHAAIRTYGEIRPGYLADRDAQASVTTLHQYLTDELRAPLWALFAAVACVLLVACANVANLLLARIAGRGQELALRSALGAGRLQLAGQVLLESAILAVIGGSLGLLFADWLRLLLVGQLSPAVRQSAETGLDLKVLAFAFLVAILAAGFSGLLPALRAAKVRFGGGLRGSGGTGAAGRQGLHRALVALEAGLAVVLVLGAGLLSKNFATLLDVDPGFDTSNVLTAPLQPTFADTDEDALEAARSAWFEQVVQRVADIPGVESVGAINRLPLTEGNVGISFRLADDDPEAGFRTVSTRLVTPRLIETLRIPLIRGRPLSEGDRADSPLVGLVSENLAQELWGDRDPIGERLVFDNGELWFTVVGVVGDIHQNGLAQPPKTLVYQPLAQAAWERRMALAVRTSGDPAALVPALKEAIWEIDPQVPIGAVTTMNELAQESLHDARLLTGLFGLFAGLVLLLAAVGVFGVTTYAVSQSRHENGVRLALGATGSDVVRNTLRRMLTPVVAGLVAGCVVARFALSSLQGFLTTVEISDPWVFVAVPLGLAAVAALAAWIPARQATLADPMTVLSSD